MSAKSSSSRFNISLTFCREKSSAAPSRNDSSSTSFLDLPAPRRPAVDALLIFDATLPIFDESALFPILDDNGALLPIALFPSLPIEPSAPLAAPPGVATPLDGRCGSFFTVK